MGSCRLLLLLASLIGRPLHSGQYEEALKAYKMALESCPDAPASVRLGLAFCYSKLNKFNLAERCFRRSASTGR